MLTLNNTRINVDLTSIVCSQPSVSRSATTTRAPSLAKIWHTALPIPLAPPVTSASLPESITKLFYNDKCYPKINLLKTFWQWCLIEPIRWILLIDDQIALLSKFMLRSVDKSLSLRGFVSLKYQIDCSDIHVLKFVTADKHKY